MKKLIAFFEIPASDFHRAVDFYETVLGMQLPTLNVKQKKWLVSQKKVKPSVLSLMLQISTFFLQRMECLSISTVRI